MAPDGEDWPFGGRVVLPDLFDAERAELADVFGQLETAYGQAHGSLVAAADVNVAGDYAATAGAGELAHAEESAASEPSTLSDVLAGAENVEQLRQAVLPHLPPPDTPVDIDFVPPPVPPATPDHPDPPPGDVTRTVQGCREGYSYYEPGVCVNDNPPYDAMQPWTDEPADSPF